MTQVSRISQISVEYLEARISSFRYNNPTCVPYSYRMALSVFCEVETAAAGLNRQRLWTRSLGICGDKDANRQFVPGWMPLQLPRVQSLMSSMTGAMLGPREQTAGPACAA